MNNLPKITDQQAIAVADKAFEMTSGSGMGDLRIGLLVKFANALMIDRLNCQLAKHGLASSAYFAMVALYGGQNSANPSELCAVTGETRGNMTRICDDLVNKGLLERIGNPNDRRRVDLSLTAKGVGLLQTMMPSLKVSAQNVYDIFSPEERLVFISLLTRLNQRLSSLS